MRWMTEEGKRKEVEEEMIEFVNGRRRTEVKVSRLTGFFSGGGGRYNKKRRWMNEMHG